MKVRKNVFMLRDSNTGQKSNTGMTNKLYSTSQSKSTRDQQQQTETIFALHL